MTEFIARKGVERQVLGVDDDRGSLHFETGFSRLHRPSRTVFAPLFFISGSFKWWLSKLKCWK